MPEADLSANGNGQVVEMNGKAGVVVGSDTTRARSVEGEGEGPSGGWWLVRLDNSGLNSE